MGSVISADGKNFDVTVPVLIIGAGACGCTAALAAHEQGVEVMILAAIEPPGALTCRGDVVLGCGAIPKGFEQQDLSLGRHPARMFSTAV